MKTNQDPKLQIEQIKTISKSIQFNNVYVLTGKNGTGKSLVRKLVGFHLADKLGTPDAKIVASTSLQQRTELKSSFGAFSSIMHDDPSNPTSLETFSKIQALLKVLSVNNKRFLVIDEPEIGMGEEMVLALIDYLNNAFNPLPEFCLGVLIITHNRVIVKNLNAEFLNLENMSKDEWLNREIVPTDLNKFKEDSLNLFLEIQNTLNKK
jgi:ATPase subunit of ABC transporter with duplicated ATPase domains